MTWTKLSPSRAAISMLCGLTVAATIALTAARADESNKRTILTVSQTVQLGDAVLQPGQYVVKLLDSATERHVVQIFNREQTHIIATVVAVPIERVAPRGHTTFTFYETAAGSARALRTWYYPGDSVGQQFVYPKHHEMLAANTTVVENPLSFDQEVPAPSEPVTQASNEQPSTAQQTPDEPSADRQVTEQPPAQTEVAQDTAPAADNSQTTTEPAAPDAANQPATQLPQTSTSYPEIGLLGMMLLALAGLARVTRRA